MSLFCKVTKCCVQVQEAQNHRRVRLEIKIIMAGKEIKILPSCIPLPLDSRVLEEVVSKAKDYALMHGVCMRSRVNFNPDALQVNLKQMINLGLIGFCLKQVSRLRIPFTCLSLEFREAYPPF